MSTSIELSNLSNCYSCKFCLDDITFSSKNSYIVPCNCKGTIEYIHTSCLLQFFSYYKTSQCNLCMSPFRFIKWYHNLFSLSFSLIIYVLLFYLYFNLQLIFLWSFNYPSYTYKQLILFKLSKIYFLLFDIWITSLILIIFNLILNNTYFIINIHTISTLPILSIKFTYKTILFQLIYFTLIYW